MNYYPHHIGDYAAATRGLSLMEHGAYRVMLDLYYLDEKPLPASPARLCRVLAARSREEKSAVSFIAGRYFQVDGTTYDSDMHGRIRPSDEHADHVLNQLLADERRHWDWPASIHAIVMDMPRDWRICLYGTAMEYSQSTIGQQLGLRQQLVSAMLANARQTVLIRLKVLARTQRVMREMGVGCAPNVGRIRSAGASHGIPAGHSPPAAKSAFKSSTCFSRCKQAKQGENHG